MARGTEIETMSIKELRELRNKIEVAIDNRQKNDKVELKEKMRAMAEEAGMSLDEVLGGKGRGKAGKGSVAAKYKNPEDPSQTWTGRGRQPLWLVDKLTKRGVTKEDFAI